MRGEQRTYELEFAHRIVVNHHPGVDGFIAQRQDRVGRAASHKSHGAPGVRDPAKRRVLFIMFVLSLAYAAFFISDFLK